MRAVFSVLTVGGRLLPIFCLIEFIFSILCWSSTKLTANFWLKILYNASLTLKNNFDETFVAREWHVYLHHGDVIQCYSCILLSVEFGHFHLSDTSRIHIVAHKCYLLPPKFHNTATPQLKSQSHGPQGSYLTAWRVSRHDVHFILPHPKKWACPCKCLTNSLIIYVGNE